MRSAVGTVASSAAGTRAGRRARRPGLRTGAAAKRTARTPRREARRLPAWVPLALALGLLAGLAVAALRVDLIRVRYGLAQALEGERTLLEERRNVLAEVRALRDPARLARLAEKRGFARPERILDLPMAPTTGEAR